MANDSNEYSLAIENLKARLKAMQITYAELAEIGMSESGVKKIFTGSDGSFQRIAQICRYAGVSMAEIMADHPSEDDGFTTAQQNVFLNDPGLFKFYWMIGFERAPVIEAEKYFRLSKEDSTKKLKRLEEIGLVKLLPGERLWLPPARSIKWVGDHEFMRRIYQSWSQEMVVDVTGTEQNKNELFILRFFKMMPSTYREFLKAHRDLEREFIRRALQEMRDDDPRLENVRWLSVADQRSFIKKV